MMRRLLRLWRGAGRMIVRRRLERDIDDELRSHVEMTTEEYIAEGLTPQRARRRAVLEFGGIERAREESRDVLGVAAWAHLGQDVRYALRSLRKSPVFTTVAVLVLALGIGLNSAILSVVVGAFLRDLPFRDADRLVALTGTLEKRGWQSSALGIPEIRDIESRSPGLSDVAIYSNAQVTLDGDRQDARRVQANYVSPGYFEVLGVDPLLGALFSREQDAGLGARQVAVLSEPFWRGRFGGDATVLGQAIRINGETFTIVGVLPARFRDMMSRWVDIDIWLPLGRGAPIFYDSMYENRRHRLYGAVARIASADAIDSVQAEVAAAAAQLRVEHPNANRDRGARIEPLRQFFFGSTVEPVTVLYSGSALVLGICGINLLSLMLVRARSRRREIGLRSALGASRWRLARQLATESVLLALAGALLGLTVARITVRLLVAPTMLGMPTFTDVSVDLTVVALSCVTAGALTILFGLCPALRHSRVDPMEVIGPTRASIANAPTARRSWNALLLSEAAVATILLVGAGLTAKSLHRLATTELGFATDLVTLRTDLAGARYADPNARVSFGEQLVREAETLSGIDGISVWAPSMIGSAGWHEGVTPIELDTEDPANLTLVQRLHVTPGSLRVAGIPLLRGRDFTWDDRADRPGVVIVSRKLAERLWPGEDAVGRRLWIAAAWEATVIGVAAEALHRGKLAPEMTVAGDLYFPFMQWSQPTVSVLVRTALGPRAAAGEIARAIERIDPELAVFDVAVLADRIQRAEARPRFVALLMAIYAGVALLLAVVGTYGVVAYTATQRRGEIAVRLAVGAPRPRLLWLVFRQGVAPVLAGLLLGLGAALFLLRSMSNLLFGVTATDPEIYLAVGLSLAFSAALACYLSARRATAIDPMEILRSD